MVPRGLVLGYIVGLRSSVGKSWCALSHNKINEKHVCLLLTGIYKHSVYLLTKHINAHINIIAVNSVY